VAHACNLSYSGGGDRRITVHLKASLGKVNVKIYEKIKLKQKGLGLWLQ
jgi:hypothetical protein